MNIKPFRERHQGLLMDWYESCNGKFAYALAGEILIIRPLIPKHRWSVMQVAKWITEALDGFSAKEVEKVRHFWIWCRLEKE